MLEIISLRAKQSEILDNSVLLTDPGELADNRHGVIYFALNMNYCTTKPVIHFAFGRKNKKR